MAETDWAKTGPDGIARAEINVAPSDTGDALRSIKDDGTTYLPLSGPGVFAPGFQPPEPPVPTEEQLRSRLIDALEVQRQADDRLAAAKAAHDRAEAHRERCESALQSFAGLDNEIAEETIAQLVGDAARVELSASMQASVADRDRARISFAASVRAAEELTRDHHSAREVAIEAGRRADELIAAVLVTPAVRIAERHAGLLAEASACADLLQAFNQFAANRHVSLPLSVRKVLGSDSAALARRRDQSAWCAAADALRQDPMAIVEIV
jgi:hypothetical protein